MFIKKYFYLAVIIFSASSFNLAYALDIDAKQGIMIDYETGNVLYEKNSNVKMPTSSMSKVLTAYIIFDAIKNDEFSMDDSFLISKKAWKKGGSKMFIEVDKRVKIKDLLHGLLTQSGNDAAIALGEGYSGSEDTFALKLNEKAKSIGMDSSHFVNASGWPDPMHYSTAMDLLTMSKSLIDEHPEFYKEFFSKKEFSYGNITQKNRNPLLFKNIGADGFKTGHTEDAGYGLIGSGEKEGRRVIFVINGMDSRRSRAENGSNLLEWGLNRFKNVSLFSANDNVASLDVIFGQSDSLNVVPVDNITVSVMASNVNKIKSRVIYESPLIAPIKKGQVVAKLVVIINDRELSYPLIAAINVDEQGFFAKIFTKIKLKFMDLI